MIVLVVDSLAEVMTIILPMMKKDNGYPHEKT